MIENESKNNQINLSPRKILIADDNKIVRNYIGRVLESAGHDVVMASDGIEALTAYEESSFDLILLDVQMPKVDGYSVAKTIRRKESLNEKNTPIAALTANTRYSDVEKSIRSYMDYHFIKPINIKELLMFIYKLPKNMQEETKTPAKTQENNNCFSSEEGVNKLN